MDYFKYLPSEITLDILSRLPTESVLECKLVSTTWRILVLHPSFSKMHLNHPSGPGKLGFLAEVGNENEFFWYFEYNHDESTTTPVARFNFNTPFTGTSFVGSCNGLICLAQGRSVFICNPITRECVMLPKIILKTDCTNDIIDQSMYWTNGFGYVSWTDEYKVVVIYTAETKFVQVHIYTLGSGRGWRNLGKFASEFSIHNWDVAGVFANEALYWLDYKLGVITTFDLADEKFCEHLSLPPFPQEIEWWYRRIGVLDGFLFFAICLDNDDRDGFNDIWVLKKKKNDNPDEALEERQSLGWSKEFRVDDNKLLAITKSGDCVLTYNGCYLKIFDTKTSISKRLFKSKDWFHQVSPHKNTFVSLKELGEQDTKTMESVEIEETKSHD